MSLTPDVPTPDAMPGEQSHEFGEWLALINQGD